MPYVLVQQAKIKPTSVVKTMFPWVKNLVFPMDIDFAMFGRLSSFAVAFWLLRLNGDLDVRDQFQPHIVAEKGSWVQEQIT